MGLKGSFREFSPTDIIQLIYVQKKSGRLRVHADGCDWVLGFEDGYLVQAATGLYGMPRMGEILVRQGYLDREALAKALAEQAERPRHLGLVLESMGVISHEDIARALTVQVQETALNLFFHTNGDFVFERVPVKYDADYLTPVNTEFVLMEGARRVDEWPRIQRVVGGGDTVFAPMEDVAEERINSLGKQEKRVFEKVDGDADVATLIDDLAMGVFDTCRVLAELADMRLIVQLSSGDTPMVDPISGGTMGLSHAARMGVIDAPQKRSAVSVNQATAVRTDAGDRRQQWWLALGTALMAISVLMWMTLGRLQ